MQQSARTIGGAGTGKTRELMGIVEKLAGALGDPKKIGFVSYTRNARREASSRACNLLGGSIEDFEKRGYFRTLHSICYKLLEDRGQLITDDRKSKKWLASVVDDELDDEIDGDKEENYYAVDAGKTDAGRALSVWHYSRACLIPLERAWEYAKELDVATPSLKDTTDTIERYESAKRIDNKMDFTDLMTRFAGVHCSPRHGIEECAPDGSVPAVEAWILDEAQDTTPLAGRVFQRLINTPSCRWVYLSGDPFQSVYYFCGADPKVFMQWPITPGKEKTAPKSYRCPEEILALGERILSRCSDYFNRHIQPADHEGKLMAMHAEGAMTQVKGDEDWLILVRAKYQIAAISKYLSLKRVPHKLTKGNTIWNAPKRHMAISVLRAMERGEPILADEWPVVLDHLNFGNRHRGVDMLVHGTKARFGRPMCEWGDFPSDGVITMERWPDFLGIKPQLAHLITTGQWRNQKQGELIVNAAMYLEALSKYGRWVTDDPKVTIGTIHSSKGSEADNVLLFNTTTKRCVKTANIDEASADAEHRVWYVGVTRARKKLIVATERSTHAGNTPSYNLNWGELVRF